MPHAPVALPDGAAQPAQSWLDLLDQLAADGAELVLETRAGGRVVLLSEERLRDLERRAGDSAGRPGPSALTGREREVLALVGRGLRSADVARELNVADNTVAQHLISVRRKLAVRTTRDAVAAAGRLGWLDPEG